MLAEGPDGLLGFAFANRSGLIWALFVAPGHEARGIGTRLLAHCLDWLRAEGVAVAFLETGQATRAEAFYRRRGWHEVARGAASVAFRLSL